MNIALYGRSGSLEINGYIQQLISKLESLSCKLWIYQPFYESIRQKISFNSKIIFFNNHDEIAQ